MNRKHSQLEMFLRKFMHELGLGYQCYYNNYSNKNFNRSDSYPGHWWIRVWDQRPQHYKKAHKGELGFDGTPAQKWYNNQETDEWIDIIGPVYPTPGIDHKDDFLKWLLFEGDFFDKMCSRSTESYFKNDFMSEECIGIKAAVEGKDLSPLFVEFEELKRKHTS